MQAPVYLVLKQDRGLPQRVVHIQTHFGVVLEVMDITMDLVVLTQLVEAHLVMWVEVQAAQDFFAQRVLELRFQAVMEVLQCLLLPIHSIIIDMEKEELLTVEVRLPS